MNVIDLQQRTPAWLDWRAEGVSASEVAVILGLSPYKTPWRLWAEKTGLVRAEAELSSDWFRRQGTGSEDAVRSPSRTSMTPCCWRSAVSLRNNH